MIRYSQERQRAADARDGSRLRASRRASSRYEIANVLPASLKQPFSPCRQDASRDAARYHQLPQRIRCALRRYGETPSCV